MSIGDMSLRPGAAAPRKPAGTPRAISFSLPPLEHLHISNQVTPRQALLTKPEQQWPDASQLGLPEIGGPADPNDDKPRRAPKTPTDHYNNYVKELDMYENMYNLVVDILNEDETRIRAFVKLWYLKETEVFLKIKYLKEIEMFWKINGPKFKKAPAAAKGANELNNTANQRLTPQQKTQYRKRDDYKSYEFVVLQGTTFVEFTTGKDFVWPSGMQFALPEDIPFGMPNGTEYSIKNIKTEPAYLPTYLPAGTRLRMPKGTKFVMPEGMQFVMPEGTMFVMIEGTQLMMPEGTQLMMPEGKKLMMPEGTTLVLSTGLESPMPPGIEFVMPRATQFMMPEGTKFMMPEGTQLTMPEGTCTNSVRTDGSEYRSTFELTRYAVLKMEDSGFDKSKQALHGQLAAMKERLQSLEVRSKKYESADEAEQLTLIAEGNDEADAHEVEVRKTAGVIKKAANDAKRNDAKKQLEEQEKVNALEIFGKKFPGVDVMYFADYYKEQARQRDERNTYLRDKEDKRIANFDWNLDHGFQYMAEDELRQDVYKTTPEEAFPVSAWDEYKKEKPNTSLRIQARIYNHIDAMSKNMDEAIKRRQKIIKDLEGTKNKNGLKDEEKLQIEEKLKNAKAVLESTRQKYIEYEWQKLWPLRRELQEARDFVEAEKKTAQDQAFQMRKQIRDAADAEAAEKKREATRARKEAKMLANELAKAEGKVEKQKAARLKQDLEKAAKAARQAALAEKKAQRKANVAGDLVDRLGSAAMHQAELAAALAIVDKESDRLQKELDSKQDEQFQTDGKRRNCTVEDFPWLNAKELPQQNLLDRCSRKEGGLQKQDEIHQSQTTQFKITSENKVCITQHTRWPVTQVAFSMEQHDLLFVTQENAELTIGDDASAGEQRSPLDDSSGNEIAPMEIDDASASSDHEIAPMVIGAPAAQNVKKSNVSKISKEEAVKRKKLLSKLDEDDVLSSEVILFNKPYARFLLKTHLTSLKEQHDEMLKINSKAMFVDVAGALGPITDAGGNIDEDKLSETVETLLPFFENMLRYRNTVLKVKEIELENELDLIGETQPSRSTQLKNNLAKIKAKEVKSVWGEVAARRMLQSDRGQLPGQLYMPQPSHPPLRISAPPRVGKSATALLVASIAKRIGMTCMYSVSPNKIAPIAEICKKMVRIGWRSLDDACGADKAEAVPSTLKEQHVETKSMRMKYNFRVINDMIDSNGAPTDTFKKEKENTDNTANDGDKTDMVLYSSDVLGDVQRAAALLAEWRRTDTVIFHIRDEAQSLAKEEKNELVASHKEYVPPPQTLQYLRYYFGNLYGLNCLVTATLFPTLLEEDLWGFFGSIGQNIRAGLSISAPVREIRATLGANYLPKIVPALRPYVSPGYIGVEHIQEWTYPEDLDTVCSEVNKKIEARSQKKGTVGTLQWGANHSGIRFDGSVRTVESASDIVEAKNQKKKREKSGAHNKRKDDSLKNTLSIVTKQLEYGTKDTLCGEKFDDPKDANYTPTNDELKSDHRQFRRMIVNEDARAIDAHFNDWLTNAKEGKVDTFRSNNTSPSTINSSDTLVPTYIGALNAKVADSAMVSFVRHFGMLAHNHTKKIRKDEERKGEKRKKTEKFQSFKDTCGVAFCLFTSIFSNRADIVKSAKIRFVDDTSQIAKEDGFANGTAFRPCDGPAETSDMSLVCFVYNPDEDKNSARDEVSKGTDAEPAFRVFMASTAEVAIEKVWNTYQISKVAILGYGMLQAGLTVQSVVTQPVNGGTYKRIYCPQYVALATAEDAALDAQLQIAGRAFVELKNIVAPDNWKIKLLGVQGMVDRLVRYSSMENILANINTSGNSSLTMFEALKESFSSSIMTTNAYGTLGVVGVRRGDFGSILGLTAEVAKRRAMAAANARDRAKKNKNTTLAEADQFAIEELQKAEDDASSTTEITTDPEDDEVNSLIDAAGLNKSFKTGVKRGATDYVGENDDEDGGPNSNSKTSKTQFACALREAPYLDHLLKTTTGRQMDVLHHILRTW